MSLLERRKQTKTVLNWNFLKGFLSTRNTEWCVQLNRSSLGSCLKLNF